MKLHAFNNSTLEPKFAEFLDTLDPCELSELLERLSGDYFFNTASYGIEPIDNLFSYYEDDEIIKMVEKHNYPFEPERHIAFFMSEEDETLFTFNTFSDWPEDQQKMLIDTLLG